MNPEIDKKWLPRGMTFLHKWNRTFHIIMHKHLRSGTIVGPIVMVSICAWKRSIGDHVVR